MDIMRQTINLTNIQPADLGETVYIAGCGANKFITLALSNDHVEALSTDQARDLAHNILNACDHIQHQQNQAEVTKRTTISITAGTRSF